MTSKSLACEHSFVEFCPFWDTWDTHKWEHHPIHVWKHILFFGVCGTFYLTNIGFHKEDFFAGVCDYFCKEFLESENGQNIPIWFFGVYIDDQFRKGFISWWPKTIKSLKMSKCMKNMLLLVGKRAILSGFNFDLATTPELRDICNISTRLYHKNQDLSGKKFHKIESLTHVAFVEWATEPGLSFIISSVSEGSGIFWFYVEATRRPSPTAHRNRFKGTAHLKHHSY